MFALRLAQGEYFTRKNGQRCLYLLDDFASELDANRRQLLAERLKSTQAQVFVSAITSGQVKDIDVNSRLFSVEHGKIEENHRNKARNVDVEYI